MTSHLPPGFRFHPTDQELINCYLTLKLTASLPSDRNIIADIDLYKFNPWELPGKALFGDEEWYFFSPREKKYPNGVRPNRTAGIGYWKATGTDKSILSTDGTNCIGVKKALVFYMGRAPKGIKTDWVMHEYRILDPIISPQSHKQKSSMRLDDWVLCRVKQKGSSSTEFSFTETVKSVEREELLINSTSFDCDWNENQILDYLFEPNERKQSIGGVLDYMGGPQFGGGGVDCMMSPAEFLW